MLPNLCSILNRFGLPEWFQNGTKKTAQLIRAVPFLVSKMVCQNGIISLTFLGSPGFAMAIILAILGTLCLLKPPTFKENVPNACLHESPPRIRRMNAEKPLRAAKNPSRTCRDSAEGREESSKDQP